MCHKWRRSGCVRKYFSGVTANSWTQSQQTMPPIAVFLMTMAAWHAGGAMAVVGEAERPSLQPLKDLQVSFYISFCTCF